MNTLFLAIFTLFWVPEMACQVHAKVFNERHAFVFQQPSHDFWVSPRPTSRQLAISVHDPMGDLGHVGRALTHRPTDHARGPGGIQSASDRPIGRNSPLWNASHNLIYSGAERSLAHGILTSVYS